jgi:ABC-type maltose transport system permease subunit
MTVSVLYSIPAIVFFHLVQRRIVSGLTAGSVKG